MTHSDKARVPAADPTDPHAEAQAAADSIRDQIAAVRARVRRARDTLHEHARRVNEHRSVKR